MRFEVTFSNHFAFLNKDQTMEIDPNAKDVFVEKNFFSQIIPVEERKYVFNKLFFHYKKDWQQSFALMLFLSVGIASLGLSNNSTATIIEAVSNTEIASFFDFFKI